MILVDTSVWIEHLRAGDEHLKELLNAGQTLIHPFVIGELALGNLKNRKTILDSLEDLPHVTLASNEEVLDFIENYELNGLGIGYIDTHLLASARLSNTLLWTYDKRLKAVAAKLNLFYIPL